MVKKKKDETEESVVAAEETAVEETAVEASAEEVAAAPAEAEASAEVEPSPAEETAVETASVVEEKPKKAAKAAPKVAKKDATPVATPTGTDGKKVHKRAEKIGIVASDKMMKTVTVRVDRLVKHPVYRKYVKRRKKFMAHDEMGAKIGDKVRIVETRPLSARKRWRVVEIIQKAEL